MALNPRQNPADPIGVLTRRIDTLQERIRDLEYEQPVYSAEPVGIIKIWGTDSPPDGYLICDGSEISRTTYSGLFNVIGTTFGAGDGSSTFNLPDLSGRFPIGKDPGDSDFDVLGETGGEKDHTLVDSEMPSHRHYGTTGVNSADHHHDGITGNNRQDHDHSIKFNAALAGGGSEPRIHSDGTYTSDGPISNQSADHDHSFNTGDQSADHNHSYTTSYTGSDDPHNNVPPYQVVNFIIKA